ncbi:AraC family transcriptional regulator [Pseudomonas sp. LP_7_YM]|uniref:AraC family transcriptional regulator n=1 Tax=Pseudomonas sp. LP_7_YM TaxID=2485137 RepID=UPI0010DE2A43|nr:AraC family transcriptional regulator [Pseudomonas sp. LP_7_YM]TDV72282.1 AraC family transcriptional regulator [Pseudomonas sp. LP_7_YM]
MKTPEPIEKAQPLQRISAQQMPDHLPEESYECAARLMHPDVQMQVYTHRSASSSLLVPAVAEPMLVLVLSGGARVQERALGQAWSGTDVVADDFFLTMTHEPYEMQWQTREGAEFRVVHLYLSQRLLDVAAHSVWAGVAKGLRLLDVSGAKDRHVAQLVRFLHKELVEGREPNTLYVDGIAQALAVYLVRHYRDDRTGLKHRNALPAYRLHRVLERMNGLLGSHFSLSALAAEAGLSDFYFSRLFRQSTGYSPSQYFIQLRLAKARQLLSTTRLSIIEISLEVGYDSPGHFAQVFRRHTGMTPRQYRQQ